MDGSAGSNPLRPAPASSNTFKHPLARHPGLGRDPVGSFLLDVADHQVLLLGAILWIPILLWREIVRSRSHGFLAGFMIRAVVVSIVVATAVWAPTKDSDLFVVNGVTAGTMTLEELSKKTPMIVPQDRLGMKVALPSNRPTIRQVMKAVQQQTGMDCTIMGKCGVGSTILWGTSGAILVVHRY